MLQRLLSGVRPVSRCADAGELSDSRRPGSRRPQRAGIAVRNGPARRPRAPMMGDDARALSVALAAALGLAGACGGAPAGPQAALERLSPVKVLDADATLRGSGASACSHQEPPSGDGDRWCVFSRPTVDPELVELWVVDVSAAARGEAPVCDGADPRCLRLSRTAPRTTPSTFEGDTLVVYADAVSAPGAAY